MTLLNRDQIRQHLVSEAIRFNQALTEGGRLQSWTLDMRSLLLSASFLKSTVSLLWQQVKNYQFDTVVGMTLSADPLIVGLLYEASSENVHLCGSIVRKEAKRRGMCRLIEGHSDLNGAKCLIVDDLMNTGSTIERVREEIHRRGGSTVCVGIVVDFQTSNARELMREHRIPVHALFTHTDLGLSPTLPEPRQGSARLSRITISEPDADSMLPISSDEASALFNIWSDKDTVFASPIGLPGQVKAVRLDMSITGFAHERTACVVADANGRLICLDLVTMQVCWQIAVMAGRNLLTMRKDRVFVSTGDEVILALDRIDGKIQWISYFGFSPLGPPVSLQSGEIVVASEEGVVFVYDGRTGTLLWRGSTPESLTGAPYATAFGFAIPTMAGTVEAFVTGS
jgi:orotate phosphoribosyltransferase